MDAQRLLTRCLTLAILVGAMALTLPTSALAEEQRCKDLGAECICSEPLQATAYSQHGASWFNPNDSIVKPCNGESNSGFTAAITRNDTSKPPQVGTKATVLASFPPGHTVQRYLELGEGHIGTYEMGHWFDTGVYQRMAIRWYQRHSTAADGSGSSEYEWSNKSSGPCDNAGKWFSLGMSTGPSALQWDTANGENDYPLIYAWNGSGPQTHFEPGLDCCNFGPGFLNSSDAASNGQRRVIHGHWYRYEVVVRHFDGTSGIMLQAFRKDVTAGGPLIKIIDSTIPCSGCGTTQDWTTASGATTALTPPGKVVRPELQFFRNPRAGGSCPGSKQISHFMVANFPTDAGQMIGPAIEIEGGGGDVTPPQTPTNLRITQLIREE